METFDFEHIKVLRNNGQFDEVIILLDVKIKELEELYDLSQVSTSINEEISQLFAKCLGQKAIIYRHLGEFEKAKVITQRAISFAENSNDKELVAILISDIGVFQYKMGNIKDAERNLQHSLLQLEILGSLEKAATVRINYACILLHKGEFEKCLPLFKQSLLRLEKYGDSAELGSLLSNIAYTYENIGKKELALLTYVRSKDLLLRIEAIPSFVCTSLNLVALYIEEELYELAKVTLDNLEQYLPKDVYTPERIDFLINLASYYSGLQLFDSALSILDQLESIPNSQVEIESQIYINLIKAKVFQMTHRLEESKGVISDIESIIADYSKPEIEPYILLLQALIAYEENNFEYAIKLLYQGLHECEFLRPGTKIYRDSHSLLIKIYSKLDNSELRLKHQFELVRNK